MSDKNCLELSGAGYFLESDWSMRSSIFAYSMSHMSSIWTLQDDFSTSGRGSSQKELGVLIIDKQ